MKNFSFLSLICFVFLQSYKIYSFTSFLIDKREDENKLAENILDEIKENEKEDSGICTESNILEKNDFSFDHNKINCEEIKKLGQQKTFCKKKISTNDKKELSNCIKSFCKICCEGGDDTCDKNCTQSHSLFPDHDPEEMLLSVCSLKNMTDSFQNVCDTLLTDKKAEDYTECYSNICYDCCSNALSITDFKDSKMKKCLLSCMKRVNIEKKLFIAKRDSPAIVEKNLTKINNMGEKEITPRIGSDAIVLVLSPANRQNENFKICGKLILSQKKSMTKDFGQIISSLCYKNYNIYNFISPDACLDDLCNDCCKILDEEMNIKACIFQCQKNSHRIPLVIKQPISVNDQEPKQNNPSNNVAPMAEETNIFNFNLIKSICDVKYFKGCHESLCNDFCRQSYNLLDSDCVLNCDNHMKKIFVKNEFIEHIIKTHQKFEIKMENENVSKLEKSHKIEGDLEKTTTYTGIDSTIEKSKEKIKILKDKLLEEEKNLLNIYKIKWK